MNDTDRSRAERVNRAGFRTNVDRKLVTALGKKAGIGIELPAGGGTILLVPVRVIHVGTAQTGLSVSQKVPIDIDGHPLDTIVGNGPTCHGERLFELSTVSR